MGVITFKDGSEYMLKLQMLSERESEAVAGRAIFEGAAMMMRYTKKGIESLQTDERHGTPENPTRGPTKAQKEGMMKSAGIAHAREDNGFVNVKIGFGDYNNIKTKRWPKGQPNNMVARSVERGTSFMLPQPFMKRAVKEAKSEVIKAMQEGFNEKMKEIMEGK